MDRAGFSPHMLIAHRARESGERDGRSDRGRDAQRSVALWQLPIPQGWERPADRRLLERNRRYQRGDMPAPKLGSEHELELQVLGPDPWTEQTTCFGGRLIDGVNAVPLSRDSTGGRRGNVEADMLLLTAGRQGRQQLLVEVKTTANNAWYATIESLRQLKLFLNSPAAQQIFAGRQRDIGGPLPIQAAVLAPPAFYSAPVAKQRSVKLTRQLITTFGDTLDVMVRLATWDPAERAITDLAYRALREPKYQTGQSPRAGLHAMPTR